MKHDVFPADFTGRAFFDGLVHEVRSVDPATFNDLTAVYTACRRHMFEPWAYEDPREVTCMVCLARKDAYTYPVVTEEYGG